MADDELDVLEPWTIKKISRRVKETAIDAARQEGITIGEWLERRLSEWIDAGMPVRVRPENRGVNPVNLRELVETAVLLASQDRKDTLLREARGVVRERLRGLRQPRLAAPVNPVNAEENREGEGE